MLSLSFLLYVMREKYPRHEDHSHYGRSAVLHTARFPEEHFHPSGEYTEDVLLPAADRPSKTDQ